MAPGRMRVLCAVLRNPRHLSATLHVDVPENTAVNGLVGILFGMNTLPQVLGIQFAIRDARGRPCLPDARLVAHALYIFDQEEWIVPFLCCWSAVVDTTASQFTHLSGWWPTQHWGWSRSRASARSGVWTASLDEVHVAVQKPPGVGLYAP